VRTGDARRRTDSARREERGLGERSAVQEVQETLGLPVVSVLRLRDLLAHLEAAGESAAFEAVRSYRDATECEARPCLTCSQT